MSKKEHIKPGYVYAPYTPCEHTEESLKEYNDFMSEYNLEHKLCPKCGEESHMSTLMGYVLVHGKESEYKDLNRCTCMSCGDSHTTHERVKTFKK